MSDVDRLVNLYWALSSVLTGGVAGDVVEIGCNAGRTSVFLRMVLDYFAPERELHVYDSFEGLPAHGERDVHPPSGEAYLKQGMCTATVEELREAFARWDVREPTVHRGWFADILPSGLPEQVAFAYLDGDYYESTRESLVHLYPRLSPGAIAIIDDYCDAELNPRAWDLLPGPKHACDEFFEDKPERVSVLVGSGDLGFGCLRKAA